ncbi:amine sulfotransferase-like [Polypterus senegalus]|nr:amine sulfotransferase-like [Polypterus senegalus]
MDAYGPQSPSFNSSIIKYKGFRFINFCYNEKHIDSLETFETRGSDVFVVTYPKSGTVWTQQIMSLICPDEDRTGEELMNNNLRFPWIEFFKEEIDHSSRPSPRFFTSHLPYNLVPNELRKGKGKVIYVSRNPKDVMVSYFHFTHFFKPMGKAKDFSEFMDSFLNGNVPLGSWFDHLKGWYDHRDEFNILFISYEEMIKDLRAVVIKICKFLGKKTENMDIDKIVEEGTFNKMKKNPKANYEWIPADHANKENGSFMRKGTIGDWKNTMTVAQNEKFDQVFQEKMKDLPLKFIWDINE